MHLSESNRILIALEEDVVVVIWQVIHPAVDTHRVASVTIDRFKLYTICVRVYFRCDVLPACQSTKTSLPCMRLVASFSIRISRLHIV